MWQRLRSVVQRGGEAFRVPWRKVSGFVRRQPAWRLGLYGIALCLVLCTCVIAFIYLRALGGAYGTMPGLDELRLIENSEASSVISEDGKTIAKYYRENRTSVPLDEISPYVQQALIATEDARFFEHQGVDLRALGRVLVKSIALQDRSSGGGSTISQQLAKQLYPRRNNGWASILKTKVREMMIASRLEEVYSKDDLLALYLNTVPFGENAYGIEVASKRFFSKSAADLQTEEAAVLVGLLKANTTYSPRAHPTQSRERRNVVLALMARNGSLSQSATDSLQSLPLAIRYRRYNQALGSAPHFRDELRREVQRALAGKLHPNNRPYDIDRDGLQIHVSINSHLQRFAEQAIREELPRIQLNLANDWAGRKDKPWLKAFDAHVQRSPRYRALTSKGFNHEAALEQLNQPREMTIYEPFSARAVDTLLSPLDSLGHYFTLLNASLLVTQARDGVVRAWVGGADHRFVQYDHVRAKRQVGSTIKPVVYATALEQGMMPCEYTPAAQFTLEDFQNYRPRNANGKYEGAYSMRGGLAKSVNTVAVSVAVRNGLDQLADQVSRMGIENPAEPNPSLALGSIEASLPEMNTVYSAFANGGVRPEGIHYLDKVTAADGTVIVHFERPQATRRVLSEATATTATFLLAGVVNSGTATKLRNHYGIKGPVAGKTGTTQDQRDGWFIGYTPKLVISTWVGAEYPAVHFRTLSRGSATATALPIWGNFMRKVQGVPGLKFYKGGSWPGLDDMSRALLECPDFIEDVPLALMEEEADPDARRRAGNILGEFNGTDVERMMQKHRRRRTEAATDYARRIAGLLRKERKKEERRRKRKKFWSRKLFGRQ